MFTTTYTDVFSGRNVTPAFPQYSAISLSSNITLSWPAQFQNLNSVVSVIMDITPTGDGFTITMPTAQEAGTGVAFTINNPSGHSFNLLDSTGALIVTIASTTARIIWLINNSTAAGTWRTLPGSAGGSSVTSVNATSSSNNLVIGGVPITAAGTITFALANDLLALSTFGASTGFTARTAANTWALRDIVGTAGSITITNGDGIAGNPTIALDPNISITTLQAGNILLSGNTISSTNLNGPINLAPNGTGPVTLSASNPLIFYANNGTNYISFQGGASTVNQTYIWPTTTPTAGQSLGYSGGSVLAWQDTPSVPGTTTVNAIARYSNTVGGLKDSPAILLDDAGNLSSLNSCIIGQISIAGGGGFGPQTIATTQANESLILAPNGIGAIQCEGNIWVYPSAGSINKIRFYNLTAANYSGLAANPAITSNQTWTLPQFGSTAGVFYTDNTNTMSIVSHFLGPSVVNNIATFSDTAGSLQDSGVAIFSGPSTVNAIATFSNTAGSIQNSPITIDTSGNMTLTGSGTKTLSTSSAILDITAASSINMTATSGTIVINSNGIFILKSTTTNVVFESDVVINSPGVPSSISLINTGGIVGTTLQANDSTVMNYTLKFPAATAAGYMLSDSVGNLSFLSLTTVSTNIPQFTNTTGSIGSSPISISAGGSLTGVTSLTIGNINLGTTGNTIASTNTNGNINLAPNGSGLVSSSSDIQLLLASTQLKLRLYNSAGTFYTALQAGAAAANTTFTLPLAAPAATGLIKSNSSGAMSIDSLGATAGVITTDGSGNVTIATATTVANQIAKYSSTTMSSLTAANSNTGAFIDANNNISLGTANIATSAVNTINLVSASGATAASAGLLCIGNRNTGTGNVIALYGGGDGGVSTSTTNTITNKISVYVNGTRYYLLASTSAT